MYLARHGFTVTGIDFSEKALAIARKQTRTLNLPITFVVGDITALGKVLSGQQFDFILDYSILHHLEPGITGIYARQCAEALKPGGALLLVCYSEKYEDADTVRKKTKCHG